MPPPTLLFDWNFSTNQLFKVEVTAVCHDWLGFVFHRQQALLRNVSLLIKLDTLLAAVGSVFQLFGIHAVIR